MKKDIRVCLVGANGKIGQKLALLLKLNPYIQRLNLIDITDTSGIQVDLSHIDTCTSVISYPPNSLTEAMNQTDIIAISAGMPRKPGMTRDDLFKANADIIKTVCDSINKINDNAVKIAVITNPINSIIPFTYEYLMRISSKKPDIALNKRLFGITTLDCVRACTFYAEYLHKSPTELVVPVIGGHSDSTIVPLFSQASIPLDNTLVARELTKKVREAGTRVVEAYKGDGSATFSMAYAANRFINSLIEASLGKTVYECSFVYSIAHKEINYMAHMLKLNEYGVCDFVPFGNIYEHELDLLNEAVEMLKIDQKKGEKYAETVALSSKTDN